MLLCDIVIFVTLSKMMDQELYIRRHRVPGVDAKMCGPCDF